MCSVAPPPRARRCEAPSTSTSAGADRTLAIQPLVPREAWSWPGRNPVIPRVAAPASPGASTIGTPPGRPSSASALGPVRPTTSPAARVSRGSSAGSIPAARATAGAQSRVRASSRPVAAAVVGSQCRPAPSTCARWPAGPKVRPRVRATTSGRWRARRWNIAAQLLASCRFPASASQSTPSRARAVRSCAVSAPARRSVYSTAGCTAGSRAGSAAEPAAGLPAESTDGVGSEPAAGVGTEGALSASSSPSSTRSCIWPVRHSAATPAAGGRVRAIAVRAARTQSAGSCSAPPSAVWRVGYSALAAARVRPERSSRAAFAEVVPRSRQSRPVMAEAYAGAGRGRDFRRAPQRRCALR